MMISTRGRYALRVMIELAKNPSDTYIKLEDIACNQGISKKYLEAIIKLLVQAGLVTGVRGKGGGYRLAQPPETYTVGQILRLTEGTLAPVACLECDVNTCPRADTCPTLPMWKGLYGAITAYLDGIPLDKLGDKG